MWSQQAEGEALGGWILVSLSIVGKGQVHRVHLLLLLLRVENARAMHVEDVVVLGRLLLGQSLLEDFVEVDKVAVDSDLAFEIVV